ncbi:Inner membrane ABC transporter permease protein ycjP [uncultured Pleomorphomonas sp.]|uniref:Inner membrane ABC transporter permease protein ycjP n=1 Tax=uncultured Pleomorphomonas sp. TaxID=442121 RepID=A0A212L2F1_9HYPH|nr:carbohydrate ABC transporter permease [uncultured Pleomorphomonas sp.]SCM71732.1 Inner membrane ABC transporter permease protein ycjP [uncultured Pleomorphomonas sp.]
MVERTRTIVVRRIVTAIGILCILAWSLAPVYWVVVTSLKTSQEIYSIPPTLLPRAPTLDNYRDALFGSQFARFVLNSFVVALGVTAVSAVIGALTAYPISRMSFPGRATSARLIVAAYLLPPSLLFIPLFIVLQRLGLIDTRIGLVLAYLTFTVPFCTWMLIGYFRTIPKELDEAALMDGASRLQTLTRVVLPIATPGIAVVALFAFTHAWNEFLYALVYVYSNTSKTFTAGLSGLVMGDTFIWGELMASSVIAIAPILIIYIAAQKYIVEGLAAGSVKG